MDASNPGAMSRDPQSSALIRLRGVYPSLKTALQKVANLILRQPEMAIYASVNEVAAAAQVSEATVMRFCRTLGFKGFQDFKIALARELVTPSQKCKKRWAPETIRLPWCAGFSRITPPPWRIPWKFWILSQLQQAVQFFSNLPAADHHRGEWFGLRGAVCRPPFHPSGPECALFYRIVSNAYCRGHPHGGGRPPGHLPLRQHPGNPGRRPGGQRQRGPGHRHHQQLHGSPDPHGRPGAAHLGPGDGSVPGPAWPLFSARSAIIDSLFALLQQARPE